MVVVVVAERRETRSQRKTSKVITPRKLEGNKTKETPLKVKQRR